jgi:hypothetical protein
MFVKPSFWLFLLRLYFRPDDIEISFGRQCSQASSFGVGEGATSALMIRDYLKENG